MKTVVVYKSKTGYTKRYAEWIAKDLNADLFDSSTVTVDQLATYDTIIFGGGLYAVGVNGVKLITKNMEKLQGKKIIVYATGASPGREEVIDEVRNNNLTAQQQEHVSFFYLRGGFDYSKLGLTDKILMTLLKMSLKRKKELTADERGMLNAYNTPVDFTRKDHIDSLLQCVKDK